MGDLVTERKAKLEMLRARGIDPFPYRFERTLTAREGISLFESGKLDEAPHSLAGRMMSLRVHGKSSFSHIQDMTGRIQVYFKKDVLGDDGYEVVQLLDIGDLIGVTGKFFRTKTGEITVLVEKLTVLAKALRTLPIVKQEQRENGGVVLHDRFSDKEQRYRQRYVDLIVNPGVLEKFLLRSRAISFIRSFLEARGFIEVETPILQPIYGGAAAKPFVTHHNVLDMKLYLRIADELYLKRLIVGGFERVFEFCKDFRNEGIDRLHNPEFTMVELYQAFADYGDMMKLLEDMIPVLLTELFGTTSLTYQGQVLDFSPPWRRISFLDAIEEHTGQKLGSLDEESLWETCARLDVDLAGVAGVPHLLDRLMSERVEPHLVQPTFIVDYPAETTPLAKRKRNAPSLVERFELFVSGIEIANAFSELTDPIEQRKRFEEQIFRDGGESGEKEGIDEDFIRAMEYGMPPTGGLGIGIDRLAMLISDAPSIKEIIFFPHLRPHT